MHTILKSIFFTAAVLAAPATDAAAGDLPGYERLAIAADHRVGALDAAIWYPAEQTGYRAVIGDSPVFHGTFAMQGTAAVEGRYPLLLISHGSGGNIQSLGWLTGPLAVRQLQSRSAGGGSTTFDIVAAPIRRGPAAPARSPGRTGRRPSPRSPRAA